MPQGQHTTRISILESYVFIGWVVSGRQSANVVVLVRLRVSSFFASLACVSSVRYVTSLDPSFRPHITTNPSRRYCSTVNSSRGFLPFFCQFPNSSFLEGVDIPIILTLGHVLLSFYSYSLPVSVCPLSSVCLSLSHRLQPPDHPPTDYILEDPTS